MEIESLKLKVNFQFSIQNSSEGTTVPKQAVKRIVRNPCKKSLHKKSKRRRCNRIVDDFFCRAFGTLIDIRFQ
jgi:hypothetical protein